MCKHAIKSPQLNNRLRIPLPTKQCDNPAPLFCCEAAPLPDSFLTVPDAAARFCSGRSARAVSASTLLPRAATASSTWEKVLPQRGNLERVPRLKPRCTIMGQKKRPRR